MPKPRNVLSIDEVAELFSVPLTTVRSWRRRYDLASAVFTRPGPGGRTAYEVADVKALVRRLAGENKLARYRIPEPVLRLLLANRKTLAKTIMRRLREEREHAPAGGGRTQAGGAA